MTVAGRESGDASPGSPAQPRRAADWYELFFDLVFVVVVAVSARVIEADQSLATVVAFVLLFFPLWWAWVNLMVTNNIYGPRYPVMGFWIIAAMPGPAVMAVAIATGITEHGWLYAAGGTWIRLVLLVMWIRPHVSGSSTIPLWRPFVYNVGTAALWAASIAVPPPYRYGMWALAVAVEVVLLSVRQGAFASEVYDRASASHLLDRVGLFVVIVIGEAVYLSVTGLAKHPTVGGGASALFGFIVCALLVRAFFRWGAPTTEAGLLGAQRDGSYGAMRDVVMYLPFLLVTALTFIAASIGIAVGDVGDPLPLAARILLACGIGGFYLANALVGIRLRRPGGRVAVLLVPGILLPALACLLTGALPAWGTVAAAAAVVAVLDVVSTVLAGRPAAALE